MKKKTDISTHEAEMEVLLQDFELCQDYELRHMIWNTIKKMRSEKNV